MTLRNDNELANTQNKLATFETRYEELRDNRSMDPRVRELSMRSVKSMINQFKEEIARYQAQHKAH